MFLQHTIIVTESRKFFCKNFELTEDNWISHCRISKQVTTESSIRCFQQKLLNRLIFANDCLFKMKIISSELCDFCREVIQTRDHLFVNYVILQVKYFIYNCKQKGKIPTYEMFYSVLINNYKVESKAANTDRKVKKLNLKWRKLENVVKPT